MQCGNESFGVIYNYADEERTQICEIMIFVTKNDKNTVFFEDEIFSELIKRSVEKSRINMDDYYFYKQKFVNVSFPIQCFEGVAPEAETIPASEIENKELTENAKKVIKALINPKYYKDILDYESYVAEEKEKRRLRLEKNKAIEMGIMGGKTRRRVGRRRRTRRQ